MFRPKFVFGVVKSIDDDGLVIDIKDLNQEGYCKWRDLSDYECNYEVLSKVGNEYCFCVIEREQEPGCRTPLSYRFTHPEEQKIRKRIVPTASHYFNLAKYIYDICKQETLKNEKIKMFTFKDLLNEKTLKDQSDN